MRRLVKPFAVIIGAAVSIATASIAAAYPTRPVTLVVAFPPGGPSDVVGRILAKKLHERFGQPFVVDNRPGAGGNIAAEAVARAAPDGHTILLAMQGILVTNQFLYRKINYQPQKDLAPISYIGSQANILVVHPGVPAKTLDELIALARANPGKLNFASGGFAAGAHLAGELFKAAAKLNIVHVPYKGTGPAFQDVVAGHVQMMFPAASSVVGAIKSGQVRALAVTTPKRTAVLPDVPTLHELGLKDFDSGTWHGLVAPANTSRKVIDTLNRATSEALKDAEVQATLRKLGVDIVGGPPEALGQYIKQEISVWSPILKDMGSKLD